MNSPNNNSKGSSFIKKIAVILIIGTWLILGSIDGLAQEIDPNGYNVFRYENGRIASEGHFKNGQPDGIWKSYYSDGTLKSIGLKSKGLSDSTWVFFDDEGRKSKIFDFALDQKNGCAQYLDTNGRVIKEVYFIEDVPQDEILEYYSNGKLKKRTKIENGKEVGLALEYNESGEIITEVIYDNGFLKERNEYNRFNEIGEKTGVWRTFHPNGTIESEIGYENGKKSGLAKTYNKKGKLIDLRRMDGDTLAGHKDELVIIDLYKAFYEDGKIKLIGGINNGLKNGIFREYDKEGEIINGYIYDYDTLIAEGMISAAGIYQGEWRHYYKIGKLAAEGNYIDSKKDGKWIYYYANGKKEQEGKYVENELKGEWKWYYQNGQIKRIEFYNKKSLLEGSVFEYDSLGNEMTRGEYYNGLKEGDWFYQVGDYKEVGSFSRGYEDGIWNYYYLNGRLAFTGAFNEGEPKGKHVYYHQNGIPKLVGKYLGGEKHGKWKAYNRQGEKTQVIEYRRGEMYRIDGFKVEPVREES